MTRAGHILDPRNAGLYEVINGLGLTAGLELCLDAGHLASGAPGVSQWISYGDSGSQVARPYYRGNDTFDTGSDLPTFTGTRGARTRNEYWLFDGGDFFTAAAQNAWQSNLHKDNATFTLAAWVYFVTSGAAQVFFSTMGAVGATVGTSFGVDASDQPQLVVANSGSVLTVDSGAALTTAQWAYVAISLNEATGAGGVLWNQNGTAATDTSTYTTPSAANATHTAVIGATTGGAASFLANTSRVAMLAAWSSALTAANLDAIYQATRGRFKV